MTRSDRNALTNQFCGVLKKYFAFGVPADPEDPPHVHSAVRDDLSAITASLLNRNAWYRSRYSHKHLNKQLEKLVEQILEADTLSEVPSRFDLMLKQLDEADERKLCLVPLRGIALASSSVEIGRFKLTLMDEQNVSRIVELMNAGIGRTIHTEDQKIALKRRFEEKFRDELTGSVCVESEIHADPEKADEIIADQAQRVLDILRYAIPTMRRYNTVEVGLKGDGESDIYRRYVFPVAESGFLLNQFRIGPDQDCLFDQTALEVLQRTGVLHLASADPENLSELQEAAWKAIHWFAESQTQRKEENQLIELAISMESLFSTKRGVSTSTLAEGAAVLLGTTLEDRLEIIHLTKAALEHRGKIVHEGVSGKSFADLKTFRNLVGGVIASVIQMTGRFKTPSDLLEHIWREKLTPKPTASAGFETK